MTLMFSEKEMRGAWPWGDLAGNGYDLIMADPPWTFKTRSEKGEEKSAQKHYDCMPIKDIAALPVAGLAAENCLLWLWATAPMIDQQIEILKGWGFTFKTQGAWIKRTKNGHLNMGTGYFLRGSHEPFLIGTRGKVRTTRSTRSVLEDGVGPVINALIGRHSEKPTAAYIAAEKLVPGARRVELFSRTSRPGWEHWGNETGKFDGEANHVDAGTGHSKPRGRGRGGEKSSGCGVARRTRSGPATPIGAIRGATG